MATELIVSDSRESLWEQFRECVGALVVCDYTPIQFATDVKFNDNNNGLKIVPIYEARARYSVELGQTCGSRLGASGWIFRLQVEGDPVHAFEIHNSGEVRRTYPNGYGSFGREHLGEESLKYLTDAVRAAAK